MATPKKSSKSAKSAKPAADAEKPAHVAPVVNLTQAAQSAALLLAARRRREAQTQASGGASDDHVNASAFKQMKAGLTQPTFSSTSPLASLNKAAKPTGSAGFMKQVGHGQAGGANVARTGVPRRTSGG